MVRFSPLSPLRHARSHSTRKEFAVVRRAVASATDLFVLEVVCVSMSMSPRCRLVTSHRRIMHHPTFALFALASSVASLVACLPLTWLTSPPCVLLAFLAGQVERSGIAGARNRPLV